MSIEIGGLIDGQILCIYLSMRGCLFGNHDVYVRYVDIGPGQAGLVIANLYILCLTFYYCISQTVFHLLGNLATVGDDCWHPWLYLQRLGRLNARLS